MLDAVGLTISTFIASILAFIGFLLGERQSRGLGHELSEKILDVLQRQAKGKIDLVRYNRKTGEFDDILENPDSTTSSPSANYSYRKNNDTV